MIHGSLETNSGCPDQNKITSEKCADPVEKSGWLKNLARLPAIKLKRTQNV